MNFEEFRLQRFNEPPYDYISNPRGFARGFGSDISAHLPLLQYLASCCDVVVEFGTRDCYSTCAFLAGKPCLVRSYDIESGPSIQTLNAIEDKPTEWQFYLQDTGAPDFDCGGGTMLFIDTLHTYEQVKKELLHADFIDRWIVLHDTYSFPEINQAITEFLNEHRTEWQEIYRVDFNHGLVILERTEKS